jgi:hypothetical protein
MNDFVGLKILNIYLYGSDGFEHEFIEFVHIALEGNKGIELHILEDTDEIEICYCYEAKIIDEKNVLLEKFDSEIKKFIGCKLLWWWEMKNNNGYLDAFQVELIDTEKNTELTIQFKALGSSMLLYHVSIF